MTFEPLHIFAPTGKGRDDLFVVLLVFIRKPETVQTVKLTLVIGSDQILAYQRDIYVQLLIHRMNQTAHISLQIFINFKERGSENPETKSTGCA